MCFFSRTMHVLIRLLRRNVLFVVYNKCPGQHDPQISRQLNTLGMLKRELTLSPKSATTVAELRLRVQDAWDNLSQDDIRHIYDRLHARIHACVVY